MLCRHLQLTMIVWQISVNSYYKGVQEERTLSCMHHLFEACTILPSLFFVFRMLFHYPLPDLFNFDQAYLRDTQGQGGHSLVSSVETLLRLLHAPGTRLSGAPWGSVLIETLLHNYYGNDYTLTYICTCRHSLEANFHFSKTKLCIVYLYYIHPVQY